eukprot:scaffold4646_cov69-Phaeocystis_antarctica.AAC.1
MSKDKEGMGSEARIALNLHKRPRRRAGTWSVGIGEGCGDTALYIFDLRNGNASPITKRSFLAHAHVKTAPALFTANRTVSKPDQTRHPRDSQHLWTEPH